jgi:hypothetical protein
MKLTSGEAAAVLDIGLSGLRMLVKRGKLTPIKAGAHPLEFHAVDVFDLQVARRTPREQAEINSVWSEVDATLAPQVSGV